MNYRLWALMPLISFVSCQKNVNITESSIVSGSDPYFKIVAHSDPDFASTNRKVDVFGIPIYAYSEVEDVKLLHAANIMAQYLDNDEDGKVDNPLLIETLIKNNAALFMWKKMSQVNLNAQDLGADESRPEWHTNGHIGQFDAALEEVWHVISHSGYAQAYPSIFGEEAPTQLTEAMDLARGGHFINIPHPYPIQAWYTYEDRTCEYECMAVEYIYWALTSMLGAQENRLQEISQEWNLNSNELVKKTDKAIYLLLSNPEYSFPKSLPNGSYRR